ncbi:hypothetical protein GpartN1_g6669.t1 [Galdieria partita]|uniref:Beta-galactosidase n=1 Tax=Galdieria partita TaxID=83374 RepID=A0A9C7Q1Q8_9RHOD|nr:hypothetical protein GpartN1_g6669.t1 [Galdieria partita]
METQGLVSFDSRAVTLNGKRTLLLGGSIQYPKVHHTQWEHSLKLAKECGLNFLDIYVFWNVHEKRRGVFTFTENGDICRFLQMAHQQGLLVMLRLGPYICAETSYGGFPYWLREIPDIQFRTYNEPFMREVKRWLLYLTLMLKEQRLFFPQGGPIILVQLENEYDLVSNIHLSQGEKYLNWYSELYRELAVDVPLIMCRSSPDEVGEFCSSTTQPEFSSIASTENCIETLNSFYGHKKMESLQRRKPHKPILWTEFWIGWYDIWVSPPRKRSIEDIVYAELRFIAQGGAGFSYYMFHGGTHFNNLAMYSQITSYYFESPIDEYGRPSFLFHLLSRINHMLHDLSIHLLSQERPQVLRLLPQVIAFIWKENSLHQKLTFLCNDGDHIAYVMFHGSMMKLNPLSVAVFFDNEMVFDSSSSYDSQIPFRDFVPLQREYFQELETFQIDVPIQSVNPGCEFSQLPDMLNMTQDETDYLWYTASAMLPVSSEKFACEKVVIDVEVADFFHLFINQQYVGSSLTKMDDERFANENKGFRFSLELEDTVYPLPVFSMCDKLHISLLVCSLGLIKGEFQLWEGATMEKEKKGLFKEPKIELIIMDSQLQRETIPLSFTSLWTVVPLSVMKDHQTTFVRENNIKKVDLPLSLGPTYYKQLIIIDQDKIDKMKWGLVIDFSSMTKGIFRWNSFCCGRYYSIRSLGKECDPSLRNSPIQEDHLSKSTQRYYHVPKGILQERNQLEVFEEIGGNFMQLRVLFVT